MSRTIWMLLGIGLVTLSCRAQNDTLAAAAGPGITSGAETVVAAASAGRISRGTPHVAYGKNGYLAVWREGWEGKNGGARICGVRLSPDGKMLDAKPVEIAPNPDRDAPQERPRVAFCQNNYLVVWFDLRNGVDYDVLAARVDADGKVLDAKPIVVAGGVHNQVLPDVAADADGFLVVWQGFQETGNDRAFHGYAVRVEVSGKVGEPVETGIVPQPKVAWNGRSFLVSSSDTGFGKQSDVVKLDPIGKPVGKKVCAMQRTGFYSLSGVPGKGWLLVSHRSMPDAWGWGGPGATRVSFITEAGVVDETQPKETATPGAKLDPTWLDVNVTTDPKTWPHGPTACAWDGKHTVAVWQRHHLKNLTFVQTDLMGMQVDGWKRLKDEAFPIAASEVSELNPSLASDGAGHLMCVYEKEADGGTAICARPLTSSP
jgi:hypothetical protein